jgi:hypothetical protein
MEWQQLLIDGYERIAQVLERALSELSQEDLNWQPHPDCNSMGWMTWHLTRVQDNHVADLMGEEELYVKDSWHARFNRAHDTSDTGYGHSPQDVAAFKSPDVATLLAYHRTVMERSQTYISSLSLTELDRELNEPWYQPLPTVGVRLISVLSDNLQHAGQVAYLRGLLKAKAE